MKKALAFVLALSIFVCCLCGCGAKEVPETTEPTESIEDVITKVALLELYNTITARVEHKKTEFYKYSSKTNVGKTRYEVTLFQQGGEYSKDFYIYNIGDGYKVCGKFALYDDFDNPIGKDYYGKGSNTGTFEIVVTSAGTIEYSHIS